MPIDPSQVVEQPLHNVVYEQAIAWLTMVGSTLQSKCDQLGRLVCPALSTAWNKYIATVESILPPSLREGYHSIPWQQNGILEEQCKELEERLEKTHIEMNAKIEEHQIMRRAWDEQIKAIKSKMDKLNQNNQEMEDFLKDQSQSLLEDLHKRLVNIEHTRQETLAEVQSKLDEHHLAMNTLHEEAQASLTKVTQAISKFT